MQTEDIPTDVLRKAIRLCKKIPDMQIVDPQDFPDAGIKVESDGKGTYKAGYKGWVVAADNRTVFLGADFVETEVAEFTILWPHGGQSREQLGRGIKFI